MYNLWNPDVTFPELDQIPDAKGVQHVDIHTAVEGDYQFLLGCAITKYRDKLYASWANSYRFENDDNTILAQMTSEDGGFTWSNYKRISDVDKGFGRSHGVYFKHGGRLYAICPKAGFDYTVYAGLKPEMYVMDDDGTFKNLGIIMDEHFWPMCEPIVLDDGSIVMAGINSEGTPSSPAVALCDGKDITKWEMVIIPNPDGLPLWGETTVLKLKNKLVAIVRSEGAVHTALVSESFDNGKTWSGLAESNLPISNSKMYAGNLSNGKNYLVFNARTDKYREMLCIAVGDETFDKVYKIKKGYEKPPRFWKYSEWCYPYAYEADGKLYIAYARNKEDAVLSIIPVESLSE